MKGCSKMKMIMDQTAERHEVSMVDPHTLRVAEQRHYPLNIEEENMNPRQMLSAERQFGSEAALSGTETLKWLADQGISTFVPLPAGSKIPLHKGWNRREEAKAAHEIADAHKINVGLLCFDGIVVIDRDVAFPTTVQHLKSLGDTVKVMRTNAPARGALIYRVSAPRGHPTVYSETYRPAPCCREPSGPGVSPAPPPGAAAAPTMELLAMNPNGTAKAKVVAGSYRGGCYELHDTLYGIREITLAELDIIWQRNVSVHLKQCIEQEPAASQPQKHRDHRSSKSGNLAQWLRQTWSAYDVFEYHGYTGDTEPEPGGNLRILGHGGLIVGGHGPTAWRWYCFADDTGGDIFDAWSYCTTGAIIDRTNPESFRTVLTAMAEASGVERNESSAPKGLPS